MRSGIRARLLFTRVLGAGLVLVVLLSASHWSVNGPALVAQCLFAIGAVLAVGGFGGRLWALTHIAGRKKRELVRSGPYSACRHPLYLCSLVGGLGLAMCTGRLLVVVIYVAAFALLVPVTIRTEEAFLEQRFPEYDRYRAAVPALWPGRWWRQKAACAEGEGECSLAIDPAALRRGLLESVAFLTPLLLLDWIDQAQGAGLLPFLFVLP
jgi:protein-S-isoprenylcysteine O-methyltransferase Ste14